MRLIALLTRIGLWSRQYVYCVVSAEPCGHSVYLTVTYHLMLPLTYSRIEFWRAWHFLVSLPTRLFVTNNLHDYCGTLLKLNTANSESDVCSVLPIFKMCDLPTSFLYFFLVLCLANTLVSVFCLFNHQPTAVALSIMDDLKRGYWYESCLWNLQFFITGKKILAIICHAA